MKRKKAECAACIHTPRKLTYIPERKVWLCEVCINKKQRVR